MSVEMPGRLVVENWRELNRAFANADKDTQKQWRDRRREMAEPVRATAEKLAAGKIRNLGPRWSGMRVGVPRTNIYVAPSQRNRGGSPRPKLAPLLMGQAMEPALEQHAGEIERNFGRLLDRIADDFNHGRGF